MDWRLSEDCSGAPLSNVISISREEVCIISLGNPSLHPALINWRSMIKTILMAKPKYTISQCKKRKGNSMEAKKCSPHDLDLWFVDDAVSGEIYGPDGMPIYCESIHT